MRFLYSVLSFSDATICSRGGVARRYFLLQATARSFALSTEGKPAMANPTERGPPMNTAQSFHLDNCRDEKPAKRRNASRPASQSGVGRSANNGRETYQTTTFE